MEPKNRPLPALLRRALRDSVPVMAGYLVLGIGFGILLTSRGFGLLTAASMSLFIYGGSLQFVLIGLLTGGASLLTVFLTSLMVQARHLFYGVTLLERYRNARPYRPYLIFGLTDETYSLVIRPASDIVPADRSRYDFLITLLDQVYWVSGSLLGAAAGSLLHFNTAGMDFALTALFLTVFLEQWKTSSKHFPAIAGVGASVISQLLFGPDRFLIPAMLLITLVLCLWKEEPAHE